jgi:hypothetical protein
VKISVKLSILALFAGALILLVLGACDKNDGDDSTPPTPTANKDVVITLGNLTDKTGVASVAMSVIDIAVKDMAAYYNANDLIPGVELKVKEYDDQYDPSRDIPGYEWLKQKGANFLWTPVPSAVPTLISRVNSDEFVMFTATANMDFDELEGGYVFSLGITPQNEAYTLLDWIAKNDPDFPTDRPAKIGGVAWTDGYSDRLFAAAKEYAEAHSDKYDWEGGYLTDFTFLWSMEIEQLKDCDYVFVPTPPQIFMRDYRKAGYTAKFLGTDTALAFLGLVDRADLWDDVDGALFIRSSRWYNETGPIIDIINQMLDERHSPSEAEKLKGEGCAYIAAKQAYLMLDIIGNAVEAVGAENVDSQAIFNAATSWTFSYEGIEDFNSFDETKRIAQNYYAIYEIKAAEKDIFRAHGEWLPQVTAP